MKTKTKSEEMIQIRFGGDIDPTDENLERVTDLIIRARAAKVTASIDSNFIIQLIQEVINSRRITEEDIVDLNELDFYLSASDIEIPLVVEEFSPYYEGDSEETVIIKDEDEPTSDSDSNNEPDSEEEPEPEVKQRPIAPKSNKSSRIKLELKRKRSLMDSKGFRGFVSVVLLGIIGATIMFCLSL